MAVLSVILGDYKLVRGECCVSMKGHSGMPLLDRSRTRLDRDVEWRHKEREGRNGMCRVLRIMEMVLRDASS